MRTPALPPPHKTTPIEAAYERALDDYLSRLRARIVRQVIAKLGRMLELRTDADEPIRTTIGGVDFDFGDLPNPEQVEDALSGFADSAVFSAARSVGDMVTSGTPEHKIPRLRGIGVYDVEPWMRAQARRWSQDNARLITTLPGWLLESVAGRVERSLVAGLRHETIARDLESWLDAPSGRLKLIARDQVGKLQSNIIAGRQKELGIEAYWWGTANDRRVVGRPGGLYPKGSPLHQDHWIRRNLLFVADDLPLVELVGRERRREVHSDWTDGHPGQGIQCRCFRIPDLSNMLN